MKVLGLIPARGGSKGIPNKNRKKLGGKPLLQYTIEAALGATLLDSVVFTSEDNTLMEMARKLGATVPFKRPDALASDTAGSLEVVQHALVALSERGHTYDAVCLLQVTSPFRTSEDIDLAISKFMDAGCDSLISVQKVPHNYNPHWVFELSEGTLKIATGEDKIIKRRQELPDTFIRDGSIYITRSELLLKGEGSFYGKTISYIELDPTRHINIDLPEDWLRAEKLLTRKEL
ncbi:MAG: acylneuraminate cytidylyltransferase family protein [Flavobacteriaceae bacterium]|nr:acylneuraminate cytidylyltransferase family protein [Flavobacteriaceae bacterium]